MVIGAAAAVATTVGLAAKWQLGPARAMRFAALAAAIGGVIVFLVARTVDGHPVLAGACVWLFVVALGCAVVAYRFYRDPERTPPDELGAVVSPADGTIVYIRTVHEGKLPAATKHGQCYPLDELTKTPLHLGEARVIGIGLNFMDVHVNRAPVAGSVTCERHRGLFGSLRQPEMVLQNERVTMVFEGGGGQIAVVLIASRLVRRIVTFVHDGEDVAVGQRIGMIRFGSQVDLVIPATARLSESLEVGVRVVAGETIMARP